MSPLETNAISAPSGEIAGSANATRGDGAVCVCASRPAVTRERKNARCMMRRLYRRAGASSTASRRGARLRLEAELHAGDDRQRPARALVVDVVEAAADQLIDFGQSGYVAQPHLPEDADVLAGLEEDPGVDPEGEGRGLVVEVLGGAREIGAGRDQRGGDPVDEADAERSLAVRADLGRQRSVTPRTQV